jgi:hypothetical protein
LLVSALMTNRAALQTHTPRRNLPPAGRNRFNTPVTRF